MRMGCGWTIAPSSGLQAHGTGVAHCPCSNMRLGSGVAPVRKLRRAGVPVGWGPMAQHPTMRRICFTRRARPSCRTGPGSRCHGMSAREALEMATHWRALVCWAGDDIGCLAPGMAADFICIDLDRASLAGALHDPVAALVFCDVSGVDYSYINGRCVVEEGRLTTAELPRLNRDRESTVHRHGTGVNSSPRLPNHRYRRLLAGHAAACQPLTTGRDRRLTPKRLHVYHRTRH